MPWTGERGTDYPEEKSIVDLIIPGRGETLISWVEQVGDGDLVVTAGQRRVGTRVRVDDGERIEMVWRGPEELRALPTEFVGLEGPDRGCWRLRPTGPATRGQRREAVRAPIGIGLSASAGATRLTGVTVDISEGGFRAVLKAATGRPVAPAATAPAPSPSAVRGPAVPGVEEPTTEPSDSGTELGAQPDAEALPALPGFGVGQVIDVVVDLDPGQVSAKAEVTRRHKREDENHEVSARFIGLPERSQDAVRARVFAGLRELRQRGLI